MKHLIKKQIIELYIDKRLDAFNTQHLVSQHYWSHIVPDLGKAFDDLSDDLNMVHLDKLEIDLGVITAKMIQDYNWTPDIIGKVSYQIRKKLSQPGERNTIVKEEISLSICRQWMRYIQNGFLPWETLSIDDQWFESVLRALATDYLAITELKELIMSNPHVARRIAFQHDEKFLVVLLSIMTSESIGKLSLVIDELGELVLNASPAVYSNPHPKKRVKHEIWEMILALASARPQTKSTREILEKTIPFFVKDTKSLLKKEQTLASKAPNLYPIIKNIKPLPQKRSKRDADEETDVKKPAPKASFIKDRKPLFKSTILKEDGAFIQNAGVVLLHPFLNHFFKRQKLVDAGEFNNADDIKKAIFLLHFLATGETEAAEYQLVVPKILCDFPVEEPIEKSIELSDTEIMEAMDLLIAAIQQWDILKDTSIEGLRESFLQRNGKLLTKKDQLVVQVETSSIDLLLDHLPWNLSIIKLPWMKEILRVEWR